MNDPESCVSELSCQGSDAPGARDSTTYRFLGKVSFGSTRRKHEHQLSLSQHQPLYFSFLSLRVFLSTDHK